MNRAEQAPPPPHRTLATTDQVRRLVATQFPRWRGLPIRPVSDQGWDNQSFRVGEHLVARMPTAPEYALAIAKEHRWLPVLAPQLPLPIPKPLRVGTPGEGFGLEWSIRRWLPGTPLSARQDVDLTQLATDLAAFLSALQRTDPSEGPKPGVHNWFRGGPVGVWNESALRALARLERHGVEVSAAREMWDEWSSVDDHGHRHWFHGDVASGNLLLRGGRLAAVIDFGTCGVGDPACDLAAAWTLFDGESRHAFRSHVDADDATWNRAKGWALWKALTGGAAAVEDPHDVHGDALRPLENIIRGDEFTGCS